MLLILPLLLLLLLLQSLPPPQSCEVWHSVMVTFVQVILYKQNIQHVKEKESSQKTEENSEIADTGYSSTSTS